MRKSSLLLVMAFGFAMVLVGFGVTSANSGSSWAKTYGGESEDHAYSVIQTSDGGYALAGNTKSYGAGWADFWLVKTDSSGNEEWSKTFGGEDWDSATSVIQTSDGGYALAGTTNSYGAGGYDIWLVKTDSSGNEQWNKTFGGTDWEGASSVIQTSDGGYALAGSTRSYSTSSQDDFWLVKTDSSGNEQWNKTFGGTSSDAAYSVIQTSDGGYALAGITFSYDVGGGDFWLVKTDSSGNEEWSKTFGGENDDQACSVIQTSDGGYVIAGYTESYGAGGYDSWLVKTDSSGNEEWNKTFGGENSDFARSVIQTSDGGYALAGYAESYGAGWADFWLVKTDSSGNEEWSKTFGGTSWDTASSVIQTSDGGYALAGITFSYDVGGGDFWVGGGDFWLVKTDSLGNVEGLPSNGDTDEEVNPELRIILGFFAIASGMIWIVKKDKLKHVVCKNWKDTDFYLWGSSCIFIGLLIFIISFNLLKILLCPLAIIFFGIWAYRTFRKR